MTLKLGMNNDLDGILLLALNDPPQVPFSSIATLSNVLMVPVPEQYGQAA